MTPAYEPALPRGPEAIARARREIAAVEAEIRAGNPDVHGLVPGLVDWSCELRRLEEEQADAGPALTEEAASAGVARVAPRLAHVRAEGG